MAWFSAMHLKKGEDIFKKNTDRVSLDWNNPLNETHSLVSCEKHIKIQNKSDDGKADIVWEKKYCCGDKEKSVFRIDMNHGDCRTSSQVDADNLQQEATGVAYKEDGNTVSVGMKNVWNYNASTTQNHFMVHYAGKAFGETAKAFLMSDLQVKCTDFTKFASANVTNQWWIQDGDMQAGVRWVYDFTKKDLDVARFEAQYNIDKSTAVWCHLALKNKYAALAYDYSYTLCNIAIRNTAMINGTWGEKKQFMNTPVGFRFGNEFNFSKDMSCVSNFGYSTQFFFNMNMKTKLTKNWNTGVHFHHAQSRVGDATRKTPINVGIELWYKCDEAEMNKH